MTLVTIRHTYSICEVAGRTAALTATSHRTALVARPQADTEDLRYTDLLSHATHVEPISSDSEILVFNSKFVREGKNKNVYT
jgi:hypothetical protein